MKAKKLCVVMASALFILIAFAVSYTRAAQVRLTWDAPTTNADGMPLTANEIQADMNTPIK